MLPEAFLNRMEALLGDDFSAFYHSYDKKQWKALRLNPLKCHSLSGLSSLTATDLRAVPWMENAYYYEEELSPGKHPLHEAGAYYIQEPSAMVPARLLSPLPGDRVLDLCAAPGGKSTQLAGQMMGEGLLVVNEINPARARILSENIERLGVKNALVTNEDSYKLAEHFPGFFQKILVDAPCSGEGMFRKADVAISEWSQENVTLCANRQDEILDNAAQMLCAGGFLVYSTCTFAPAENEGSISRFLQRHPDFHIVPATELLPTIRQLIPGSEGVGEWADYPSRDLAGTIRIWPHKTDGEGHYAALLQKEGTEPDFISIPKGGFQQGLTKADCKKLEDYFSFVKEALSHDFTNRFSLINPDRLLLFGDNLYLMPTNMPNTKGLKILRSGLWLGTFKKNRFEPSHALALSLKPDEALHSMELSLEDAFRFIQGQTLTCEGEKGWYLICLDHMSLGWGKLSGGIMKNHYPKGLRK